MFWLFLAIFRPNKEPEFRYITFRDFNVKSIDVHKKPRYKGLVKHKILYFLFVVI